MGTRNYVLSLVVNIYTLDSYVFGLCIDVKGLLEQIVVQACLEPQRLCVALRWSLPNA